MDAGTLAGIALQLVVFSIVGFASGELLMRWAGLLPSTRSDRDRSGPEHRLIWVGITERALGAILGFVGFSVALMVAHIITNGNVFRFPFLVPAAAVAVLVLWWRGRIGLVRPRPVSYLKLGILLAVLIGLYALPGFISGSSIRTGDPPWHLGWTEQLLGGEQLPVGPAPEFGKNAYPWGLHAVMATLVRLVPGTNPRVALETLQLVLIAGLPMVAASLAFRLRKNAGWAAAAAVSVIGGFGWIAAGRPDFATSPRGGRYGADLVVASPNSVYEMLPPALPRELGVILLGIAGLFALVAARNRIRRVELLAGATAGLAGLVSVPMFVSSLIWMLAASLAVKQDRGRYLKHTVGGALLIFSLWGLPVFIEYLRLGGFVNITPRLGMEWPLPVALASWGLLLPLAAGGVWLAARRMEIEDRIILGFTAGTVIVLALAILRGVYDWDMWGNATLLHQGRVWPPLHLLGGVFAGAALMWLYERLPKKVGASVVVIVLGIGSVSLFFASSALTDVMERGSAGFVYGGEDLTEDQAFVPAASRLLDPDDVVSVHGSDTLAFHLFEFSGVRLAHYDHPALPFNDLRIRFARPAERWQQQMDSEGFSAGWVAVPADDVPPELDRWDPTLEGTYQGRRWLLYGEFFRFAG